MFERFTPDARATVLTAQEEARAFGHDYIGTEHLLLALLAVGAEPIPAVLGPYGLAAEAVRSDILGLIGPGEGAVAGHIPFTPRSKKVLELSLREALKLKHRTIQPGHILLGLIREGEGVAAQLLVDHGADLRRLRTQVVAHLGRGTAKRLFAGAGAVASTALPPAMTPGGTAAFDRARELAAGGAVGSQHVLLGLLGDEASMAAQALASLGVSREAAEEALARIDPAGTFDELPEAAAARRTSFEVDERVVTVRMEDPDLAAKLGAVLREGGRPVVVRGTEVPAFDQFWRAVRPALEEISAGFSKRVMAARLRETTDVTFPWAVGDYVVMSTPAGLRARLLANERFTNDAEVRDFLHVWFAQNEAALAGLPGLECVSLTVRLARPDDALAVGNVSFGPGPGSPECPRVALADLVAYAITDLAPAAGEATG